MQALDDAENEEQFQIGWTRRGEPMVVSIKTRWVVFGAVLSASKISENILGRLTALFSQTPTEALLLCSGFALILNLQRSMVASPTILRERSV